MKSSITLGKTIALRMATFGLIGAIVIASWAGARGSGWPFRMPIKGASACRSGALIRWARAALGANLAYAGPAQAPSQANDQARTNLDALFAQIPGGQISPCRVIRDLYPEFNGVAVDPENNIVALSDNNLKSLILYDRRAGKANSDEITRPLGQIKGPHTYISAAAGVTLDPAAHEVYTLDTDIGESITAFPYTARGDFKPRGLAAPQSVYGLTVSRKHKAIAVSVEDNESVVFFRLGAGGAEPPTRQIRGPSTGLADPHGIYWDDQNDEIVVTSTGSWSRGYWDPDYTAGGHYQPPSISVFSADAKGDAKPLRAIIGRNTGLDWPFGVSVDAVHGEIAVANIGARSVLIFQRTANGDATPIRVLKGPHTGISYPIGVAFDSVNDELWVANLGHTALVFDRTASGDSPPKRVIRNAPPGTPATGIGVPQAVAYDSKRDQILENN